MVISSARIGRQSQKIIASVVGLACVFIIVTAIPSGLLLINIALAAAIMLLAASVLRMAVSIESTDHALVLRCSPFYSRTVPLEDITDVSPAPPSSLTEGFGIRYLGQRTWGLLVGGPAITMQTPTRTWIVSTPEPESTSAAILAQASKPRDK